MQDGGKKRRKRKSTGSRKLKTKLSENEFYCVICKNRRKVRSKDTICGKKYPNKKTKSGFTYALVSDCSTCKHKLYKFTTQATFKKYKEC